MRKRNIQIKFRMNEDEYQNLQNKITKSGQTQQTFIVNTLAGAVIAPREEVAVLKELNKNLEALIRQIKGMATNVNQMAHIANGTGELPSLTKLSNVGTKVEKFREEAEVIWQSIRQLISQQNHTGP